ncbi:MAG: hypothetical protein OES26_26845, partial [Gammaproteobacteria bacterium]|nr:hypothetical protein [Gammaproteobacteria bacterium]
PPPVVVNTGKYQCRDDEFLAHESPVSEDERSVQHFVTTVIFNVDDSEQKCARRCYGSGCEGVMLCC